MKKLIGLGLTLFLVMQSALADVTRVEATVDKNPVMVDEAIQLTVVAEGDPAREAFDSSALLGDFVVGRTSVSSSTRIINFDKQETVTWTTTLFPRGEGNFTIPAIDIEGMKTKPITVRVIPVQSGSNEPARDYYLTTHVDASNVYLQQQLLYTTKLYLSQNIERGSLQAPELENAQIQQLGDDKQYTDIVNGKRYQVIERNFAIVPQSSGDFTIRGPVFSGEVLAEDPNARFGFFNRTKRINRRGPDIAINVQPIPSDIDYYWLPSEYVSINEEWPKQEAFTVGEPVTRTITLTADGVVEEQLPELPQMYPPDFKLYPDQASTATVNRNNRLIAQRVETLAMIPTKAGKFVLPEVKVPWFNVKTGNTEYATLPARSIEVAPATASSVSNPVAPAAQQPAMTQPAESQPSALTPPPATNNQAQGGVSIIWIYALASLWLLTLVGWVVTILYFKRNPSAQPVTPSQGISGTDSNEKRAFAELSKVIQTGTPGQVQQALHRWVSCRLTAEKSTMSADSWLAASGLQPQINAMLSCQYGENKQQWDRKTLLQRVSSLRGQKTSPSTAALSPLYPEGRSS